MSRRNSFAQSQIINESGRVVVCYLLPPQCFSTLKLSGIMIQQSVRRNHEQWFSLNTNVSFSVLRDSVEEILVHLSEYLAIYSKVFRIYLRKVLVNMHLSVSLHFSRTSACALVSVKSSEKEFHSNKRIDGLNISFPESVKSD